MNPHPLTPSPTRTPTHPGEGEPGGSATDQRLADLREDRLGGAEGLFIGEAENSQPKRAEKGVAVQIVELLIRVRVDSAIQLDDQLPFVAVEVDDVAANRYLAPELFADQPPIP